MRARQALPIALVILGLVIASAYLWENREPGPTTVVEVEMTTRQWRWDPKIIAGPPGDGAFSTPQDGSFANATIVVHVGEKVILHIRSLDVTHGFAILGYDTVRPVVVSPGDTVTLTFVADKRGTFTFYCTVFCGTGHPDHKGQLVVK